MVGGSSLKKASIMSSSLCRKAGVLQRKYALARSTTVSVAMQNMGGEFFHPIGGVSGITTISQSSHSDGKTSLRLGLSIGRKPML